MKRFIKLSLSLLFFAATQVIRISKKLIGRPVPGRVVILYYHAVTDRCRRRFGSQMGILKSLALLVSADFKGPIMAGKLYAAVTFDDAFQSVLENALDEMRSRQIPCTIFVPTAFLGTHPRWDAEPGGYDQHETIMTAEQLREIPADLVTLGSHTRTHPHLLELDSSIAEEELVASRRELEAVIQRPAKLCSLPYGEYSDEILDLCRKAGYERVYSVSPTLAMLTPDEYLTGRVLVSPNDWGLEFRLKALGAYSWHPVASTLKRTMRRWFARSRN